MIKRIKDRGFTLVELLAVIVVLAIILIIAIPRILNVVEDSEKEAFKISVKQIIKASKERQVFENIGPLEEKTYTIEDGAFVGDSIPLSGKLPDNGTVHINNSGQVSIALSTNKWCATKKSNSEEIIITKEVENCVVIEDTPSECFYYYDISPTEIIIDGYDRYRCTLDVVIPSIINGYTVVGIGTNAFDNTVHYAAKNEKNKFNDLLVYNDNILENNNDFELSYEDRSREIGERALTSVLIPETVKTIEAGAFMRNKLTNVVLPSGLTSIGEGAFFYNLLTNIDIPDSVTYIGSGAFTKNKFSNESAFVYDRNPDGTENNSILNSYGGEITDGIIIPSNVITIGNGAFSFVDLVSITIPSNVTSINDYAFSESNIVSIDMPNGVLITETSISYSFYQSYNYYEGLGGSYTAYCQNCNWKYSTLDAPPIPSYCFYYSQINATEVEIYGYDSSCPRDVIIPTSLGGKLVAIIASRSFERDSWSSTPPLEKVVIPNTVKEIEYRAFANNNISSLILGNGIISIEESAFSNNSLLSLELPNSLDSIGNSAFYLNLLSSITIPNSVIDIGNYAFGENQLTSVTIPNSVTTIGENAFVDNQLTSITIPNSVTSIGGGAFNNNQLPDIKAFIYARNLDGNENTSILVSYGGARRDNVIIPNSVTSIGDNAFVGNQLTSITIPNSVTSIGNSAFGGNQLTSVTIPTGLTSIGISAFSSNQLTSITIPNNVTSIGIYAFAWNQLKNLTIPNSVTSIGYGAFYSNQLTSVTISNSVTSIGNSAFGSNQLTSVTIPNSVTSLGGFDGNDLSSITIPNSVTSIGDNAFMDNELKSIAIPNSVTSIGKYAFRGNQLTSVTIPNSVTSIGDYAFSNNQLTSVTIPISVSIKVSSVSDSFYTSYATENGSAAGTYIAPSQSGTWTKQS